MEKRFQETQQIDTNKLNSNEPVNIKTVPEGYEGDVVRLRVRTEEGKRQIMLTLLPTQTLPEVYEHVKPYIENKGKAFELYTNFPKKAYGEKLEGNLKDLGLAPSCALIVKLL